LPDYAHFSYSGLAFYKGILHVSTNFGLLEVKNGKINKVYQFQRKTRWFRGHGSTRRISYCGWWTNQHKSWWTSIELHGGAYKCRRPKRDTIRAVMFWKGYSRQSHANGFVMVAGGSVWRWESTTNTWNSVPQPVREKGDEHDDTRDVIGVFPVGNKTVLIMRDQLLSFLVKHNQDFQSDTVVMDNGGWRSPRNDSQGGFLAEKWVMAGKSRYIWTRSGVLLRVSVQSITKLGARGDCEAIAATESGKLMASFRRNRHLRIWR
jgi:hypothetical protein